jgi:hypothetical protein
MMNSVTRSLLLLVTVLACTSEESTQMKQIAGTYAMTSHDRFASRLLEGSTMTLNADGTWRSAIRLDPSLGMPWAKDSGTWVYRPDGPTLGLRSSEGRPMNLLVRGDTLTGVSDERQVALAEAVTNVKATGGGPDAFYVRMP